MPPAATEYMRPASIEGALAAGVRMSEADRGS
jgi:hypothetical protein